MGKFFGLLGQSSATGTVRHGPAGIDFVMAKPKAADLTAEQCETQAQECRALAEQVMRQPHRVMLEHIADTWDRIASDIRDR